MTEQRATASGQESDRATLPDPRDVPTLTVGQAARVLGLSRSTAYQGVQSGVIPSIRVGHRLVVPTAQLYVLLGHPIPVP